MATKLATKKDISTDSQLKALKPCATDASYPIKGHTGLEIRVRPNNTKEFRHRYTHPQSKRRPYMTIGKYPTISLIEAKAIYFENLRLLSQNIDPLTVLNQLRQKDIHVPHGFRAAAITMIQEQLGYPKYLLDMQSGDKLKDNNGSAYNRVEFLAERKVMIQAWADYLDVIRNSL